MDYKRVYIEKNRGFNKEGKQLFEDFRKYLDIKNLKEVRVVNVYDLLNVSEDEKNLIVEKILFEEEVDSVYEQLELGEDELAFRVKYLDGQYNQREDMTEKLIEKFLLDKDVRVKHSKIIIAENIDSKDLEKIKSYYINPIEMKLIGLDEEIEDKENLSVGKVEVIDGFINYSIDELKSFKEEYGVGIDMEDLELCQNYFKSESKDPTITEIKLIDTYWSDHCRHTTFNTEITDISIEEGKYKEVFEESIKNYINSREYAYENDPKDRPLTLMDLATINMREQVKSGALDNKEVSDEVNAASIEITVDVDGKDEEWLLMFKNETHNHPTEMEPFGGAATCLGGAIRDPLSGRAFVYQAMRISGSADPREKFENTIEGKLPQRFITQKAMEGYSSYGNQIGAATGYVKEYYDEGFLAKRLECGALVAAAPKKWVYRGKAEAGDVVILVGGRTGKDGLGGAVGSSKKHTEESLESGGAEVQKGNPLIERKIMRLFRKEEVSKMIKICNDFGAGGVGVAIGELADGIDINLNKVPLKYPGLDGTEIALAESQERMAVVVDSSNLDKFLKEVEKEDLEGTHVATVTEEKILKMKWNDEEIVHIKRDFLDTNGAKKFTKINIAQPDEKSILNMEEFSREKKFKKSFKELVKDLNIGSQKGLVENFDNTVGGGNVIMPYGGSFRGTPAEGMVSKIPVQYGETNTCSIMTHGYDPQIGKWSPYHGGYYAVIDSIARVVALGGDCREVRLSFQEYFERIDNDETKWGKPLAALLGAYEVQKAFDIAAIGGKDSMSGTFENINVPPSLISFAVTSDKVENIVSNEFKSGDNQVVLIESKVNDKELIDLEDLKSKYIRIKELVNNKKILSAQTVKYGGIARSILEMSFGNKIGFRFDPLEELNIFKSLYGSIILEIDKEENLDELFSDIEYRVLGNTLKDEIILVGKEKLELEKLFKDYNKPLKNIFPLGRIKSDKENISYDLGMKVKNEVKINKPKVLIPIFTGSHGEYSLEKSFVRAGAEVETYVFKTLDKDNIEDSFKDFASKINKANIIAFPDGATFGNEPETGGKLVKLVLEDERIKKAIDKHLKEDDGLIIGVGNGFEGLLKAGYYGDNFYVGYNDGNKFISDIIDIKLVSNLSPWSISMEIGDVYSVPIATYEGKIVVKDESKLNNGQIFGQIVKENPTGSKFNIEAITSEDGRVLGTLSSVDRVEDGIYKNIDIKGNHKIFESAVQYFK